MPATNYQKWGHAPVRPGIYPCCFTQWVGRSKDLKAWVDSTANPILGFPGPHDGPGNGSVLPGGAAGDRAVIPGSVLDQFGSAAAKEMCHNKTDDVSPAHPSPAHIPHTPLTVAHFLAQINRSDGDWVELPPAFTAQLGLQGPAVYIVWICGDREFAALFAPRAVSPCSVADGGACRRGLRRSILPGVWLRGDRERLAGPVAAVVLLRLGWRARMGAGGTPRRVVQFLIVVVHFLRFVATIRTP